MYLMGMAATANRSSPENVTALLAFSADWSARREGQGHIAESADVKI